MKQIVCDRCGQIAGAGSRYHISYTGGNEADLCKECFEELLSWVKNKPVPAMSCGEKYLVDDTFDSEWHD